MRGNDVIKSITETSTIEMENNSIAIHNLNMISENNIADNFVRRQRAKTKDSLMSGIELNMSITEATRRVERKIFEGVIRNFKAILLSKISLIFSDIISDLLKKIKSNFSMIEFSFPWFSSAESLNSLNVLTAECDSMTFSTHYTRLVSIIEDLKDLDFTDHNNRTEASTKRVFLLKNCV